MNRQLDEYELQDLAKLIQRLNGDAFEVDAEVKARRPTEEYPTGLQPRFGGWTIDTIVVCLPGHVGEEFPYPGRAAATVTLVRSPYDLLFRVESVR